MKPINNKSLLAFIFGQMEKLDSGEIDTNTAREQSNLAKQANNAMKYELDRVKCLIQLSAHNSMHKEDIILREVESKNFD